MRWEIKRRKLTTASKTPSKSALIKALALSSFEKKSKIENAAHWLRIVINFSPAFEAEPPNPPPKPPPLRTEKRKKLIDGHGQCFQVCAFPNLVFPLIYIKRQQTFYVIYSFTSQVLGALLAYSLSASGFRSIEKTNLNLHHGQDFCFWNFRKHLIGINYA